MKIRTDFVTNSSSSSFVTLEINSKALGDILDKYSKTMSEDFCFSYSNNEGKIELFADEAYATAPSTKKQIIVTLCDIFEMFDEEISDEIDENADAILNDLKEFKIEIGEAGWQGDSEARYYKDNYSKKRLKEYYEAIAENLGCTPEEVSEEDFYEFVSDKISIEEVIATYNPETEKIKTKKDFYLEY
jgi:hypothetical protein